MLPGEPQVWFCRPQARGQQGSPCYSSGPYCPAPAVKHKSMAKHSGSDGFTAPVTVEAGPVQRAELGRAPAVGEPSLP